MKSILGMLVLLVAITSANAQTILKIGSGTTFKTSGGVTINLNDVGINNNGTINQAKGDGNFRFTGKKNVTVGGSSISTFAILKIAKGNGAKVLLGNNINIVSSITFSSGLLDLNTKNATLNSSASISGESESNRIIGPLGGEVIINVKLNQPNGVNPGNLGAIITSASDLGNVIIHRGHKVQSGTGMQGSIARYYFIDPTSITNNPSTVRLNYFDAEVGTQTENQLAFYQSTNAGANWSNLSSSTRDVVANWVEKTGLTSFELLTLSSNMTFARTDANGSAETALQDNTLMKKFVVGPNPNNGNFWFIINGIDKESTVSLFTVDGKLVKQFLVNNLQRQQVNGIPNGVYLLKAPGLEAFKVIVAGSNASSNSATVH